MSFLGTRREILHSAVASALGFGAEPQRLASSTAYRRASGATDTLSLSSADGDANSAIINAALRRVRDSRSGGVVILPKGNYPISDPIVVENGAGLAGQGSGGSGGYAGTSLRCTTARSGVIVRGDGGLIADLQVNGMSKATVLLHVELAVDRTFERIDLRQSTVVGLAVKEAQNCSFRDMTSNGHQGDSLLLDSSCGGLVFERVNVSDTKGSALRVQQTSERSDTAYSAPTHVKFSHCIFERPAGDMPLVQITAGDLITFTTCMFSPSGTAQKSQPAMLDLAHASAITLDSCAWAGMRRKSQVAIRTRTPDCSVFVIGQNRAPNTSFFFDIRQGTATMYGLVKVDQGKLSTPQTATDSGAGINTVQQAPALMARSTASATLLSSRVGDEPGERFRILADGTLAWGDGTDYRFPVKVQPIGRAGLRVAGAVRVEGALSHTGTHFGVRGAEATPIRTITGSVSEPSTMRALLRALAEQGLIRDQTS